MTKDMSLGTSDGRLGPKILRTAGTVSQLCGEVIGAVRTCGQRHIPGILRVLCVASYTQAYRLARYLQGKPRTIQVFDLVNAGPEHRFATANAIVANCTLGLGFAMGPAKFMVTCEKQGTKLPCYPRDRWDLSDRHLHVIRNQMGMDAKKEDLSEKEIVKIGTYFGAAEIVAKWRNANPEVVQLWRDLQNQLDRAAAVRAPVHEFELPSGRIKRYFKPHYVREAVKYIDPVTGEERTKLDKRIMASRTEGEKPYIYHGGPITENIVQAVARDIMYVWAMDIVDATGYFFAWNAYDEVIFEVPDSECDAAKELMPRLLNEGTVSSWTKGLPLEVEGGIFDHYTK